MSHKAGQPQDNIARDGVLEPNWLIPKPAKISNKLLGDLRGDPGASLSEQMQLGTTGERLAIFCRIVARIAALSDEHAGHIKPFSASSHAMVAFLEIVKRELPIMSAYKNVWPVIPIVSKHRHRRGGSGLVRFGDKAPTFHTEQTLDFSRHPDSPPSPPSDRAPPGVTRTYGAQRARPPQSDQQANDADAPVQEDAQRRDDSLRGGNTLQARLGEARKVRRQVLNSVYICNRPRRGGCPAERPSAADDRCAASCSAAADPAAAHNLKDNMNRLGDDAWAHADSAEPVLAFLRALHPEQSGLLPVLVQKGVARKADLDGLARMLRARRKQLLNRWLRTEVITELQFEALDAGLDAMAEELFAAEEVDKML